MQYRIYIESRIDKQKPVIDAIKELTSDFTIFTGTAYFNNNHRPCQVIELNHEGLSVGDFKPCIDKLKKILGTVTILVTSNTAIQVLY